MGLLRISLFGRIGRIHLNGPFNSKAKRTTQNPSSLTVNSKSLISEKGQYLFDLFPGGIQDGDIPAQ